MNTAKEEHKILRTQQEFLNFIYLSTPIPCIGLYGLCHAWLTSSHFQLPLVTSGTCHHCYEAFHLITRWCTNTVWKFVGLFLMSTRCFLMPIVANLLQED